MIAVLLALAQTTAEAQSLDQAWQALREGRYATAVAALDGLPSTVATEWVWAELYYAAGEHRLALEHAEAGLAFEPQHLDLLHRAASSALWIGDESRAGPFTSQLSQAVARASLTPEHRAGWEAAVTDFEQRVTHLTQRHDARDAGVLRARALAVAGLLGALAAMLWLAWK